MHGNSIAYVPLANSSIKGKAKKKMFKINDADSQSCYYDDNKEHKAIGDC